MPGGVAFHPVDPPPQANRNACGVQLDPEGHLDPEQRLDPADRIAIPRKRARASRASRLCCSSCHGASNDTWSHSSFSRATSSSGSSWEVRPHVLGQRVQRRSRKLPPEPGRPEAACTWLDAGTTAADRRPGRPPRMRSAPAARLGRGPAPGAGARFERGPTRFPARRPGPARCPVRPRASASAAKRIAAARRNNSPAASSVTTERNSATKALAGQWPRRVPVLGARDRYAEFVQESRRTVPVGIGGVHRGDQQPGPGSRDRHVEQPAFLGQRSVAARHRGQPLGGDPIRAQQGPPPAQIRPHTLLNPDHRHQRPLQTFRAVRGHQA